LKKKEGKNREGKGISFFQRGLRESNWEDVRRGEEVTRRGGKERETGTFQGGEKKGLQQNQFKKRTEPSGNKEKRRPYRLAADEKGTGRGQMRTRNEEVKKKREKKAERCQQVREGQLSRA